MFTLLRIDVGYVPVAVISGNTNLVVPGARLEPAGLWHTVLNRQTGLNVDERRYVTSGLTSVSIEIHSSENHNHDYPDLNQIPSRHLSPYGAMVFPSTLGPLHVLQICQRQSLSLVRDCANLLS